MTPEQLGKLFPGVHPGRTLPRLESTVAPGLGLAISRKFLPIVGRRHHGDEHLRTGFRQFAVSLPATRARGSTCGDAGRLPSPPRTEAPADRPTVVVIDDDPSVLELMERFLAKEGLRRAHRQQWPGRS